MGFLFVYLCSLCPFTRVMGRSRGRLMKTRGPPRWHGGRHTVLQIVPVYTIFHGPRPRPACKTTWATSWLGGSGPKICAHYVDHGQARPVRFRMIDRILARSITYLACYAAARSDPSHARSSWPGPVHRYSPFIGLAITGSLFRPLVRPHLCEQHTRYC